MYDVPYMIKRQVHFREEEFEILQLMAQHSGRSVADLVREAVRCVWMRPTAEGASAHRYSDLSLTRFSALHHSSSFGVGYFAIARISRWPTLLYRSRTLLSDLIDQGINRFTYVWQPNSELAGSDYSTIRGVPHTKIKFTVDEHRPSGTALCRRFPLGDGPSCRQFSR